MQPDGSTIRSQNVQHWRHSLASRDWTGLATYRVYRPNGAGRPPAARFSGVARLAGELAAKAGFGDGALVQERLELGRRHRPREQVALRERAAELAQLGDL